MKFMQALLALLVSSCPLFAQKSIPVGTTLPVTVGRTLDARKLRTGDTVVVKLSQSVPLDASARLRSGTRIVGHVVDCHMVAGKNRGSTLTLSFARILGKEQIPIVTDIRALASPLAVNDAQLPSTGPDHGTSSAVYTTVQVGGDVVYRGGGSVMHADKVVGTPVYDGVLVRLVDDPERRCRGDIGDAGTLHATYIFASSACGAYGFSDLEIVHAGRTKPVGQFTLKSEKSPIKLRAGTALLLRVTSAAAEATASQ